MAFKVEFEYLHMSSNNKTFFTYFFYYSLEKHLF